MKKIMDKTTAAINECTVLSPFKLRVPNKKFSMVLVQSATSIQDTMIANRRLMKADSEVLFSFFTAFVLRVVEHLVSSGRVNNENEAS